MHFPSESFSRFVRHGGGLRQLSAEDPASHQCQHLQVRKVLPLRLPPREIQLLRSLSPKASHLPRLLINNTRSFLGEDDKRIAFWFFPCSLDDDGSPFDALLLLSAYPRSKIDEASHIAVSHH